MQPNLLVCLFIGYAIHQVVQHLTVQHNGSWSHIWLCSALVVVIATQVGYNWHTNDRSESSVVQDYAQAILNSMPFGAVMLVSGDTYHTVAYLQHCEHQRPDVHFIDVNKATYTWYQVTQAKFHPGISFPTQIFNTLKFLDANSEKIQIWCGGDTEGTQLANHLQHYTKLPHGACSRLLSNKEAQGLDFAAWINTSLLPEIPLLDNAKYNDGTWEQNVLESNIEGHRRQHTFLLTNVMAMAGSDNYASANKTVALGWLEQVIAGTESVLQQLLEKAPWKWKQEGSLKMDLGIVYLEMAKVLQHGQKKKSDQMLASSKEKMKTYLEWATVHSSFVQESKALSADLQNVKAFLAH